MVRQGVGRGRCERLWGCGQKDRALPRGTLVLFISLLYDDFLEDT